MIPLKDCPEKLRHLVEEALGKLGQETSDSSILLTLCTIAHDGLPAARTVVLRVFDRSSDTLRIFTDVRSPKVTELQESPIASILYYDSDAKVQIRIVVTCSIVVGEESTAALWETLDDHQKRDYRGTVPPGSLISEPRGSDPESGIGDHKGFDHFCVINAKLCQADILKLDRSGHLRAMVDLREAPPVASWIAP